MTAQEYISAGYKVSLQLEQSVIDHVEAEVTRCYIEPVTGVPYDSQDAAQKAALMAVAFIGISRQQVFATRSGGTLKNTAESLRAELDAITARYGTAAHALLSGLGNVDGCSDIYGIYFKTQFFSTH